MDRWTDVTRDRSTSRRALLCACGGAGIVGVAGCLGGDDEAEAGTGDEAEAGADDEIEASADDPTDDGADGNGDDGDGESIHLESSDGWAEPHDGVEVPAEPGEAILKIGGETITLPNGLAQGGELTDEDTGVTGAEKFEVRAIYQGGSYRGDEIGITVSRMIGYEDLEGRWAESDSLELTRGDGIRLGNVIYRLYEDGRLADAELAGDLEGRRFTDGPFVHVTRDGVLTAVEELDGHVDESLNGRLEFGARLPENWTDI